MRRYRGVAAVVGVLLGGAAWVATTDPVRDARAAGADRVQAAADGSDLALPDEVVPWSRAMAEGRVERIEWGPRCDTTTGRIAIPGPAATECYAPFTGDNGGATAPGVTATTIRVVAYHANPSDRLANITSDLTGGASGVENATLFQDRYLELMQHYVELYGRRIELLHVTGTGAGSDSVAAVADAETIARDLRPFAVVGGPTLTNTFADTLASRGVICIYCTPGQPDSFYEEHAPYVWDLLKNPEQNGYAVNEYVAKRLAGRPARFAGDPAMRGRTRVFGSVHLQLGPDSAEVADLVDRDLRRRGVEVAEEATFADPTELAGTARDIITRLKDAGVTTVVYTGDPIAPGTLTKVATEQDYFPEWIVTGTALIDTTVVPRLLYDQRQWAHAFGVANLFVRSTNPYTAAELYRWYFGETSPIPGSAASGATTPFQVLLLGLQGVGADVTPERFGQVLFRAPVQPGGPTLGQVSFGNRGIFEHPDFTAVDDQAEVWWDPTAVAVDELGREGQGAWRWVDGGRRVLPGDWPTSEPDVFDPATAVVTLEEEPVVERYEPLRS